MSQDLNDLLSQEDSEVKKLYDYLTSEIGKNLVNFHVSWGDKAHTLTIEERAKVINDICGKIDHGDYEVLDFKDSHRTIDVRKFVENL